MTTYDNNKQMNYQKGKIYKIDSLSGDKIYIGSTTKDYLSQRMTAHRGKYNDWLKGKKSYMTSFILFDEYGIENCVITLIENVSCSSRDELRAREVHYIRSLACINKVIPLRTAKEYYEVNKEKMNAISREHYKNNQEQRTYYLEKNKEKIKGQQLLYYANNKDVIEKNKSEKIQCTCGKHMRKDHIQVHLTRKIHF